MKAQFDLPGFTATVLAPSDAAFTTALNGAAAPADFGNTPIEQIKQGLHVKHAQVRSRPV